MPINLPRLLSEGFIDTGKTIASGSIRFNLYEGKMSWCLVRLDAKSKGTNLSYMFIPKVMEGRFDNFIASTIGRDGKSTATLDRCPHCDAGYIHRHHGEEFCFNCGWYGNYTNETTIKPVNPKSGKHTTKMPIRESYLNPRGQPILKYSSKE